MVVPELHVVGRERRAVRPPVTLSQIESQLREVVVPFPVLGDVRHNGLEVVGKADEVDVPYGQEVRCAGFGGVGQYVQRAAVFADRVIRCIDQRLRWQPVFYGRNTTGITPNLGVEFANVGISLEA